MTTPLRLGIAGLGTVGIGVFWTWLRSSRPASD